MYESFYKFREKPFALLPDPAFLYLSRRHDEALSLLEYGLSNGSGIVVMTGEIGCGKTTLIRQMLNTLDHDMVVGTINNTHKSFGELLKWVNLAFQLDFNLNDKVSLYKVLVDFLEAQHREGKRVVLVIDEAQNLDADALEEVRMLSNINVDKHQMLQLVFVGQPELREKLLKHELRQLTQRVAVDYYLEPLRPKEVFEYIRHRLRCAGGDPDIISAVAIARIYRYSGGIPRIVNILCDTALVYGYAQNAPTINSRIVDEMVNDKKKISILPIEQLKRRVDPRVSSQEHVLLST